MPLQCRHHGLVIPLLEDLHPLLLPPSSPPATSIHPSKSHFYNGHPSRSTNKHNGDQALQSSSGPCGRSVQANSQQVHSLPAYLQRFKAYLELVSEALQSLLSSQHASKGPAELTNLDTGSAAVLRLAVRLCEAIPDSQYCQVGAAASRPDQNNNLPLLSSASIVAVLSKLYTRGLKYLSGHPCHFASPQHCCSFGLPVPVTLCNVGHIC